MRWKSFRSTTTSESSLGPGVGQNPKPLSNKLTWSVVKGLSDRLTMKGLGYLCPGSVTLNVEIDVWCWFPVSEDPPSSETGGGATGVSEMTPVTGRIWG